MSQHRASPRACPDKPICTHEMGQYLGPLVLGLLLKTLELVFQLGARGLRKFLDSLPQFVEGVAQAVHLIQQPQDDRNGLFVDLQVASQFDDQPDAGAVYLVEQNLAFLFHRQHPALVDPDLDLGLRDLGLGDHLLKGP